MNSLRLFLRYDPLKRLEIVLLPKDYGYKKMPIIDNTNDLKKKVELLDVLKELDVANKYINLALYEVYEIINAIS